MTIIAAGSVMKTRMVYYSATVFVLLLALAALCLTIPFPGEPWVLGAYALGIAVVAGLLSLLGRGAYKCVTAHYGERAALNELSPLPDDFSVITNWTAPGVVHGDTDILIIGPPGVVLIEIKKVPDKLACDGDHWYRTRKDGVRTRVRSFSWEAKRNASAVSSYLRARGMRVYVKAVLCFDTKEDLILDEPTIPVILRHELLDYVKSLPTNEPATAELLRAA